jgi:cellulose synthase/poly-beta-1,6-N-acetylglucosamine synthase-like glycosyltransferase
VSSFAAQGVELRHYDGRIGKTACLNRAVPFAKGSIVLFSDANSIYTKSSLKALVAPFQDESVGFVTGWTRYRDADDKSSAGGINAYTRLELMTKKLESRIGSCIGADGAIFAIRKALYVPLEPHDINDLVTPLSINEQGYRGVIQPDAICFEDAPVTSKSEFRRQVRIAARTIRAVISHSVLLNPLMFGLISFQLLSHKLCKLLVPLFLIGLLVSNLFLIETGIFLQVTLAAQMSVYLWAAVTAGSPDNAAGILGSAANTFRAFVVVNAAVAMGWIKYFKGESFTTWSPTKR